MKKFFSLLMVVFICLSFVGCDSFNYKKAIGLFEKEKYSDALECFENLNDYEDSSKYAIKCKLKLCGDLLKESNYQKVIDWLEPIVNSEMAEPHLEYEDTEKAIYYLSHAVFLNAQEMIKIGNYSDAITYLANTKDSMMFFGTLPQQVEIYQQLMDNIYIIYGQTLFNNKEFRAAYDQFSMCANTDVTINEYINDCLYYEGIDFLNKGMPFDAIACFEEILAYKESKLLLRFAKEELMTGSWKLVPYTGSLNSNVLEFNLKYSDNVLDYELKNTSTGKSGAGQWKLYLDRTVNGQDMYIDDNNKPHTTIVNFIGQDEFEWVDDTNPLKGTYRRVGNYESTFKYDIEYITLPVSDFVPIEWVK